MKRFVGLIASLALASCALVGPSQRDIETAVAAYLELPFPVEITDPNGLRGARLVGVGNCTLVGTSHICPVEFERSDGTRLVADVWLARYPNGWTASNVVPTEAQ